jgi:hypothetical protein
VGLLIGEIARRALATKKLAELDAQ